ncbi:hypothetical protein TNCV_4777171 [Trichonephila clavipes]|nr:hypothetical protein TNCV_4777171 [Trichonephila clavipes]
MLDHLEDNIRRVIADIRPQMLEKVIENWTSRLNYIRASRGSHMPEIIFKICILRQKGNFGRYVNWLHVMTIVHAQALAYHQTPSVKRWQSVQPVCAILMKIMPENDENVSVEDAVQILKISLNEELKAASKPPFSILTTSVWTLVPVRLDKQLSDHSTVDEIASGQRTVALHTQWRIVLQGGKTTTVGRRGSAVGACVGHLLVCEEAG